MSLAHQIEASELKNESNRETDGIAISQRLGNINMTSNDEYPEILPLQQGIIKENKFLDMGQVKIAVKQFKQDIKGTELENLTEQNIFGSLSQSKNLGKIRNFLSEKERKLAEKNLYIEHGGLSYNPKKNEAKSYEFVLNPKKGITAGYSKESENKAMKIKVDKNSVNLEKSFKF